MSSAIKENAVLSRLDRGLFFIETQLALLGGLTVFCLMLLAVVSVGGRNFFNQPIPGYVDWIEQAMPLIAFVGVSYCQRRGEHIRMDIFIGLLRGRNLAFVEFVGVLLMLLLMLLMVWGTWAHFERSFDWSAPMWSRDSSLDIRLPLWPAKLLAPVAFSVLSIRLMLQLWGYSIILRDPSLKPAGVPVIEDAATVAAQEAQSVSGLEEDEDIDKARD